MNPKVDIYFTNGCRRCELGGTPSCKVNNWQKELKQLRAILLECGLTEELKWKVPCYTFKQNNVVLLAAFKEYCALAFFKGALLNDANGILFKPGENSQAVRQIRITNVTDILNMESIIKAYIFEAIELEKAGLKVNFKKNPEPVPEELQIQLNNNPTLKASFEALTPGRKRAYILYFSQPKQPKTRESRIERYIPQILSGKGLND